jgi:hypothetical protein
LRKRASGEKTEAGLIMRNILKKKVWLILLPLGVLFVVLGILQDGYHDTFIKAIMICLECIGIG